MSFEKTSCPTTPRASRGEFLKLAALSLGGLSLIIMRAEFTPGISKNRTAGTGSGGDGRAENATRPESPTLGVLYEDAVVPWLKETAGSKTAAIFNNQRWVETPDGYIYGTILAAGL